MVHSIKCRFGQTSDGISFVEINICLPNVLRPATVGGRQQGRVSPRVAPLCPYMKLD